MNDTHVRSGSSPPPGAHLLSTAAAASLLGLTPQRLRVLRTAGNGPVFVKLTGERNGRAYYAEEEIIAWRAALPRQRSTAPLWARTGRASSPALSKRQGKRPNGLRTDQPRDLGELAPTRLSK